MPVFLSLNKY